MLQHGAVDELRRRLDRYPAERYPVQHATTQFHLGAAYADAGRLDDARHALETACALFRPEHLPVEHAKALNTLGAVHRLSGRLDDAARCFTRAGGLFEAASLPLEHGAAVFNLGLVERARGGPGAVDAFARARTLLDAAQVPGQAAAAARELGGALLAAGHVDEAVAALGEAVALASRVGDRAGWGAAANALGLAHLGAGRPAAAVEALEQAVAAHPRGVRPDAYATAKANLALAYEASGDARRAALAALQALGTPAAPGPVRAQAAAVAERTGAGPGAVWPVLDSEARDRWAPVLREELARWGDATAGDRRDEARAWVTGQLARHATADDLAECFLATLVELPPAEMAALVTAALEAVVELDPAGQQRFAAQCSRAMARFQVPQWMRLKDTFAAAGTDLGLAVSW